MLKLDVKDKKLLLELFTDGRASKISLAKRIGVSKEVLHYRLERLKKEGYLKQIIPIIDETALGCTNYRILLSFKSITDQEKEEFIQDIRKIPSVVWIVKFAGRWDLSLIIAAKESQDFFNTYDLLMKKYSTYIDELSFNMLKNIHHLPHNYLFPTINTHHVNYVVGKNKNNFELDPISRKMIMLLFEDGRMSLTNLANKLDVSVNAIKYRLEALQKQKVILGFRAEVGVSELGYDHYKVLIQLMDYNNKYALVNLLKEMPSVIYITEAYGKYDLEFEAEFKSAKELLELIDNIKSEVKLKNFEYLFVEEELTINSLP